MISPHRSLHLAAINEEEFVQTLSVLSMAVYGGVVKEGWLRKQEGATAISRKWKRRYGVLTAYRQLKWYKDEGRTKYLGFIDVGTLSSVSNGKRSQTLCQLDLHTKYGNVWFIGCDDDGDRQSWNDRITELLPDQHPMGHFVYSETSETMMDDANHSLNDPLQPQPQSLPQPPPPPGPPPADLMPPPGLGTADGMGMDSDIIIDDVVESINPSKESAETTGSSSKEQRPPKRHRHGNCAIFGTEPVFEAKCKSVRKCHSVQRLIECMHIWNGNGDEERINELLAQNGHFSADYEHILRWHLDEKNEFQALYKHVLKHIRHVDLHSHRDLTLPDEAQQNTFYVNAMYVIHCYFFGNLV